MKIISYNLREHAAISELSGITEAHDVDVLCLQEVDSADMPDVIGHLHKVASTDSNRLGLAMYLRTGRFEVKETKLFKLRKSLHDRLMAPAHERLLAAHLYDEETHEELLIGDFHAAPLTASNMLRRKQIASAHEGMRNIAHDIPAVMVGDFNYPLFQRGLSRKLEASGYQLTRTPQPTYLRYRIFSGYFDFITSSGFAIDKVNVLPQGLSDHLPISLEASIAA